MSTATVCLARLLRAARGNMHHDSCSSVGKHGTKPCKVCLTGHCSHALSPAPHTPAKRTAGMAQAKRMKLDPFEAPKLRFHDPVLQRLYDNDPDLTVVALTWTDNARLLAISTLLRHNTHLQKLFLFGSDTNANYVETIVSVLETNRTLKILHLDNSDLSLQGILQIIQAAGRNGTITGLNFPIFYKYSSDSDQIEMERQIVEEVEKNNTLEELTLSPWCDMTLLERLDQKLSFNRRMKGGAV